MRGCKHGDDGQTKVFETQFVQIGNLCSFESVTSSVGTASAASHVVGRTLSCLSSTEYPA